VLRHARASVRSPVSSTPPPPTEISTLSLHDALPISGWPAAQLCGGPRRRAASRAHCLRNGAGCDRRQPAGDQLACQPGRGRKARSEEHTSELQSRENLVCRLLLEKKKDACSRGTSPA